MADQLSAHSTGPGATLIALSLGAAEQISHHFDPAAVSPNTR